MDGSQLRGLAKTFSAESCNDLRAALCCSLFHSLITFMYFVCVLSFYFVHFAMTSDLHRACALLVNCSTFHRLISFIILPRCRLRNALHSMKVCRVKSQESLSLEFPKLRTVCQNLSSLNRGSKWQSTSSIARTRSWPHRDPIVLQEQHERMWGHGKGDPGTLSSPTDQCSVCNGKRQLCVALSWHNTVLVFDVGSWKRRPWDCWSSMGSHTSVYHQLKHCNT